MEEKKFFCRDAILIDDSGVDNFINEKQLITSRFAKNIQVFVNADNALRALYQARQLPEYIFLDIYLLFKSGFEFMDELFSKGDRFKVIKIIILTASVDPDDELKAKEYPQVIGYLGKPLSQKQLTLIKKSFVIKKA